jgi:hypothetical protein
VNEILSSVRDLAQAVGSDRQAMGVYAAGTFALALIVAWDIGRWAENRRQWKEHVMARFARRQAEIEVWKEMDAFSAVQPRESE